MIPVLNVCDLFNQNHQKTPLAIHHLEELLRNDIYIPKKPHRHSFYQVLFIEKGNGIHRIDFEDHLISSPIIYFLSPGQVHDLVFDDKNTTGILINFSEDFFNSFLLKTNYLEDFYFFNKNGKFSCYNFDEHFDDIKILFRKILYHYENPSKNTNNIIRTLLLEIFYLVENEKYSDAENTNYSSQKNIISKFEKLIEKHFPEAHYPNYYAERLSVTANYLNAVCKKNSDVTAGEIIRKRIVLEAKRLLINSELTISEIAYHLHFEDNSYFTKFFKTQTQTSPSDFRKNQNR